VHRGRDRAPVLWARQDRRASAELGFSAQSNFTRFFHNQVGVAPSEYRRAAARPEAPPESEE